MEKPAFVLILTSSGWSFNLYLEDGQDILTSYDDYPNHDLCLSDIKFIQQQNNIEGPGQWAQGWTEDGENFWYCIGYNGEPIATSLYSMHNDMHDFQKLPALLHEKIKLAKILYDEPLTNPVWADESNKKLLSTLFLIMITNQEQNIYYNKIEKDIQQETSGYLSSNLAPDQTRENTILMNRILQNVPQDGIIPGIHYKIPRMSLESFCLTLKIRGYNIKYFDDFVNEFIEVQKENSLQPEVYFNEYRTNLLLSQMSEWCADTGSDEHIAISIFDEAGMIHAIDFLNSI